MPSTPPASLDTRQGALVCTLDAFPLATVGDHARDPADVHRRTTVNMVAASPPPLQGGAAQHPTLEVRAEWLEPDGACSPGADPGPSERRAIAITPWRPFALPPPPSSNVASSRRSTRPIPRSDD